MAIIVDTSSLVMIARNYLPLDNDNQMYQFIQTAFETNEMLLLDTIHREASYTSQGIALKKMPFLNNKHNIITTTNLLPQTPRRFDNLVDNNFCIGTLRNELNNTEYIQQKDEFMKSGDAKIVLYIWNSQNGQTNLFEQCCVMTEETRTPNDGKLFKKLPLICDSLNIPITSSVDYLRQHGFKITH